MVAFIFGEWVTRRLVFASLVQGLVFGLLAMGIVLIYRSTRVINFAVGNMGLPGATLFALMVINYDFPFWPALVASLLVGALIGLVTEVVVVKRLFTRSRVVLLIATVGIADFWRAIVVLAFPDVDGDQDRYPVAIGRNFEGVGGDFGGFAGVAPDTGFRIAGSEIQTLIVVPLVAVLLVLLIHRTTFGKSITASADNPDLSRLSGVNPHVVSTVVWTIGGLIGTIAMILLSSGNAPTGITNLGPFTLTNALAAAVIAGMRSYPKAMAGGIAIAFADNVFSFNFPDQPGLGTLLVFLAVIAALYRQSRLDNDESALDFAPKVTPLPAHVRTVWWIRNMPRITLGVLLVVLVVFTMNHETFFNDLLPFWDGAPERIKPSQFFLYSTIVAFAIVACSLTVITGWSGQLSLAQMAYAGLGALSAAAFNRGVELDIGWGSTRLLDVEWGPIPAVPSIVCGAALTAVIAVVTGVGALRVRGIMLAISTFAFAIAAEQYLYQRPFFSDGDSSVVFDRGWFFGYDLSDQRTYFYFSVGCLTLTILVLGRLRRSGVGRSMIAVRDNADTASAYTISPVRTKLAGYALAGGIAGLGGALFGNAVRLIRFNDDHFQIADSFTVVSMVVIGGLGSTIGPVLGALWINGLPTFFPDSPTVRLVTSSVGFLVMLMYFPGGFVQIAHRARDAIVARVEHRYRSGPSSSGVTPPPLVRRRAPGSEPGTRPGRVEIAIGALFVVAKVVVVALVLRAAVDHLLGDGDDTRFGVYMAAMFVSGLAALVVMTSIARTSATSIGSPGTKVGYGLMLLVEPVVPFVWPVVIDRWFRDDTSDRSGQSDRSARGRRVDTASRETDEPVLSTSALTVRFGGNVAVSGVDLEVRRDEIVGLIGTNGAGKSTLMNAIGGYVPSEGSIALLGRSIESLPAPQRAASGLGRTFQAATLFPALTVRECVQVALEGRHSSSFTKSALFLDMASERRMRSEADELIDFLGLGRYADSFVSDLSTGTRRIVELAGLLAVGADVLCLDEPTAGVAQRETEAFGPLIVEIRREMDAAMLVIEHDMPLIMSISDRVYCLEAGRVIAHGDPSSVRNDPLVIASYLGTDERAIARSDT